MTSVKAFYDGTKIQLIKRLPKNLSKKKSFVILTFLDSDEEMKLPKSVKEGVLDLVHGKVYDLDSVLNEI